MYNEITIGEQSVRLLSNGATPIRYKMIFHNDLMVEINQMNKGAKDEGELLDMVSRLAFVMNCQATITDKKELSGLSQDKYIEWLEDFESMDFANSASDIMNAYLGQTIGDSKPKKGADQAKEK